MSHRKGRKQSRNKKTGTPNSQQNTLKKIQSFERVKLCGVWSVISPLHIGSGQEILISNNDKNNDSSCEIAELSRDFSGNPYFPATSIRGLMRSLANSVLDQAHKKTLLSLFGTAKPKKQSPNKSTGQIENLLENSTPSYHSRIRIYDATLILDEERTKYEKEYATHVSIDPLTRTAEEGKLFTNEVIKPGTRFKCEIELDQVSEEELKLVLGLLDQLSKKSFNNRLGKGANKVQGNVSWKAEKYECIPFTVFRKWLSKQNNYTLSDLYEPVKASPVQLNLSTNYIELHAHIIPDAPILIPDPNYRSNSNTPDKSGLVRDHGKTLVIPGSSLLGALRARCRKIARTIALSAKQDETHITDKALLGADKIIDKLFGDTNRRSLLAVSEATSAHPPQAHVQFFNAIDRFTGGASHGALYNYRAYTVNELNFSIYVSRATPPYLLTLLTYALKDACLGEIAIGSGYAYGYGSNTIRLTNSGRGKAACPIELSAWEDTLHVLKEQFNDLDFELCAQMLEHELAKETNVQEEAID